MSRKIDGKNYSMIPIRVRFMIQKKVCMLGAFAVGKSSLVTRFTHNTFTEKYLTTIGVRVEKTALQLGKRPCISSFGTSPVRTRFIRCGRLTCVAGSVRADATQIHQVLMNLCTNAEYAMRELGGILEVKVEAVEVDRAFADAYPALQPGAYVWT
jgi:Ras family